MLTIARAMIFCDTVAIKMLEIVDGLDKRIESLKNNIGIIAECGTDVGIRETVWRGSDCFYGIII